MARLVVVTTVVIITTTTVIIIDTRRKNPKTCVVRTTYNKWDFDGRVPFSSLVRNVYELGPSSSGRREHRNDATAGPSNSDRTFGTRIITSRLDAVFGWYPLISASRTKAPAEVFGNIVSSATVPSGRSARDEGEMKKKKNTIRPLSFPTIKWYQSPRVVVAPASHRINSRR